MSDIIDTLKTEFDKAASGTLKGSEGMLSKLDFKHAVDSSPLSEDDEENIESNEGMGAASAGGYSGPALFSKVEAKEATSSSSMGAYDAPGFEDVKMRGNHHRGSGRSYKKTQIPGGKFVEVKSKCKKFPYCNQGDINALNITKENEIKKVLKNLSEKYQLTENEIKTILVYELKKMK